MVPGGVPVVFQIVQGYLDSIQASFVFPDVCRALRPLPESSGCPQGCGGHLGLPWPCWIALEMHNMAGKVSSLVGTTVLRY